MVGIVGLGSAPFAWGRLRRMRPPRPWGPMGRLVRTGFSSPAHADQPWHERLALVGGQPYYFWLELGPTVIGTIRGALAGLTDQPPQTVALEVALFRFADGFALTPGAEIGELQLQPDGSAIVTRQPVPPPESAGPDLPRRRLFFPVQTPRRVGIASLRCNVYYEQILVQSYLIRARVGRSARWLPRAPRRTLDYAIARSLDPGYLRQLAPHRLSVLLNSNGDGTHGCRFFGGGDFKADATFDGQELQDLIEQARGAFRLAAWGDEQPWQNGKSYRYGLLGNREQLRQDLVRFAIRGYRFYDAIIDKLADGQADALAALMAEPGLVQVAMKESARHVLPAALIYDHGFDTNAPFDRYSLCPAFLAALDGPAPLDDLVCFHGACPSAEEETVICPSGFWGYRHRLGMPLTLSIAPEAPPELCYHGGPLLDVAVSTDQGFTERALHEQALRALRPDLAWQYAASRKATFTLLKGTQPHVVYFYCHGGLQNRVPYIQVGPLEEPGITPDNLRWQRIRWQSPRPLVFINGCHTTALEPEQALQFVSAFVAVAGAAGVIGTEITIFEPLARAFAEECLRRFFAGAMIGDAVRGARIALLKAGNPLGLVYVPFVIGSLRLVDKSREAAG